MADKDVQRVEPVYRTISMDDVGEAHTNSSAPTSTEPCCMLEPGYGITFVVEPGIELGGKYGADSRRHREPGDGDGLRQAWQRMGSGMVTIEAMSAAPEGTVATFTQQNLFAKAVHAAFYGHHPLVLSPDVIWLTIAQGLAHHVDQNAESLRNRFVNHEGKKELVVIRSEFVKGSPDNDWEGVFPEFAAQIAANTLPGTTELIESNFTTTGPAEKVASHITLMDTVQHYFSYTMCCGCGFPSISLRGTPQDWELIRTKAEGLRKYDLDWWLESLLPALDQFVAASHGDPDLAFWRSLCNINTGTSFPVYQPLTGWVQVFFPYLIQPGYKERRDFEEAQGGQPKRPMRHNSSLAEYAVAMKARVNPANFDTTVDKKHEYCASPPVGSGRGVKLELFPPGVANAPFTYNDMSTGLSHKMAFYGGLTTLVQHETGPYAGAIEPKVGWAVLDSGA